MRRFSIRNLLIATVWLAVWGALLANFDVIANNAGFFTLLILIAILYLPFVAIGSLVGDPLSKALGFLIFMLLISVCLLLFRFIL